VRLFLIICHKKRFVFLRTGKIGGSSLETYLSQFCSSEDTITPLGTSGSVNEDEFKKKNGLPDAQNYILKKKSFGIKNILNLNFYNDVNVHAHDPIDKVLKTEIGNEIKDYFFFTFVRNPLDWILRSFWWHIYIKNKRDINWINSLSQNELIKFFKTFLEEDSKKYFDKQKKITTNRNVNIQVYKYENLDENMRIIKKKLNLNGEKILLKDIRFKKLNLKREILIDHNDKKKIFENAKFFYSKYYKDLKVF
jgi:hypothetical protein